ncbi:MAG: hypothetical protein M0P66_12255, partial [Salinivirgaceae bacterium]|nr:hypothetical protein [Salinivirgaceae bacterium]
LSGNAFSQRPKEIKNDEVDGIYLSLADFKNNKLTRPIDKLHKGDKIKLKQFFISPDIISIEQDKEIIFYKDSIFAIKLLNGENYRFINRTPYLIADTSYLYIYTHKAIKTVYKQAGPRRRHEDVSVTYYLFSQNNHKAAYMLNIDNIRKYVLTDSAIHYAVCSKYTNDEMLQVVDSNTGKFSINETILSKLRK